MRCRSSARSKPKSFRRPCLRCAVRTPAHVVVRAHDEPLRLYCRDPAEVRTAILPQLTRSACRSRPAESAGRCRPRPATSLRRTSSANQHRGHGTPRISNAKLSGSPPISRWPCGSPVTPMSVSSARAADIIPRVAQGSLRRHSGPSLLVAPMPVDDDLAKRQSEEQCRGQRDIQGALSANRTRVIGLPAAKRWRARPATRDVGVSSDQQRLPGGPLYREPWCWLPGCPGCACRRVLHPADVERRARPRSS